MRLGHEMKYLFRKPKKLNYYLLYIFDDIRSDPMVCNTFYNGKGNKGEESFSSIF
jgi:hypothetical protein